MDIDFKELNESRRTHLKQKTKTYFIKGHLITICEMPGYLSRSAWNERQNPLLIYLLENVSLFFQRDVLILQDGVGLCGVIANLIGSNVTICEDEEYLGLIGKNLEYHNMKNTKIITSLKNVNTIYDYIIVSEPIYSKNIFENLEMINDSSSTKILFGIQKTFWETEPFIQVRKDKTNINILAHLPKNYTRRQLTPFKSNHNVLFELQKKRISWLEEFRSKNL